jgi:DNA invertase Pin-like site-specific DNA recombinase
MKKAFVYLRVSGKGQVSGDGFPRQRAAIRAYATAHGYTLSKEFRDEGVSGTKELENRPALTELIAALYSNGVHAVIIERLDRLARDLMVQETIIADMRKKGIEVISVAEPDLCSDDPSRKLMRQIFGAIAEYDKTMTVIKLRGARQRMRARTGRCEGEKPYGYLDGEQRIVKRMQELRGSGMAFDAVASTLNAEGVTTRYGKLWYGATVNKILKASAAAQEAPAR